MPITAQQVVDRAWIKAHDRGATKRWGADEALLWINDGRREVVTWVPRANTKSAVVTPAGGTRQTLAGLGLSDGLQFVDIPRNMAADGVTSGSAMTPAKRQWLDERKRAWHADLAAEATHFCTSDEDPTACYLWPAKSAGKIEVIYSAAPVELTDLSQAIGLADIYANALQLYVLHCFHSKDSEHQKGMQQEQNYYAMFLQLLGVRTQNTRAVQAAADAKASGA